MQIKLIFIKNDWAPGLALIEKVKSNQKWANNLGTAKKTGKNL